MAAVIMVPRVSVESSVNKAIRYSLMLDQGLLSLDYVNGWLTFLSDNVSQNTNVLAKVKKELDPAIKRAEDKAKAPKAK